MEFFSKSKRKDEQVPVAKPKTRDASEIVHRGPEKADYRGVEVIPHLSGHCDAVEKIAGKRLLASDAPKLPLPDCNAEKCNCRYAPYKDRRLDRRRTADAGGPSIYKIVPIDDGRSDQPGRRTEDKRR